MVPLRETTQHSVDKLTKAVRVALREIDSNVEIEDTRNKGILIIQYEKRKDAACHLAVTAMGQICITHTIQQLLELRAEGEPANEQYIS